MEDARAFTERVFSDLPRSTWPGAMITCFDRMTDPVDSEAEEGYFMNWARNPYVKPISPPPETCGVTLVSIRIAVASLEN